MALGGSKSGRELTGDKNIQGLFHLNYIILYVIRGNNYHVRNWARRAFGAYRARCTAHSTNYNFVLCHEPVSSHTKLAEDRCNSCL